MNCLHPRRIRNPYTMKYMYVPCRHCSACKISDSNLKCALLTQDLDKYKYKFFVTLSYDNWSVPFVIPGEKYIYRMSSYRRWLKSDDGWMPEFKNHVRWFHYDEKFPIDELSVDETRQVRFCPGIYRSNLFRHEYNSDNAQGVIYRPDIANFFKRFRKNLNIYLNGKNRSFKFKYFAIGELGTRRKRPHYHFVLYSNDYFGIGEFTSLVIQSWPLSDWSRFIADGSIKDKIKCCDRGISSYVSSYVNGNASRYGLSAIKRFQQKTWRSKDIGFGIASEDVEKLGSFIFTGDERKIYQDGRHVFEKVDKSRIDCISTRPISSKLVNTLFHKFKGFHEVSPCDFKGCARQVYNAYYRGSKELKSDDLSFMRGFFRYRQLFGNRDNENDVFNGFLKDFISVTIAYNAYLLKCQMKTYEELGNEQYYLQQINTNVDDLDKKLFRASIKFGRKISLEELECPSSVRLEITRYVGKYKKRLFGKHLNVSVLTDELL